MTKSSAMKGIGRKLLPTSGIFSRVGRNKSCINHLNAKKNTSLPITASVGNLVELVALSNIQ
jgi:hypothetical protein